MKDSNEIFNPSIKKIAYYFLLLSCVIPILVIKTNENAGIGFLFGAGFVVTAVNFAAMVAIFLLLNRFIKDRATSYIITLAGGCLFFNSTIILKMLLDTVNLNLYEAHNVSLIVVLALMIVTSYLCYNFTGFRKGVHSGIAVFLHLYVIIPVAFASYSLVVSLSADHGSPHHIKERSYLSSSMDIASSELPDIYYVIPDMYASFDVLEKEYDYSNADFYNALKNRGFHINKESYSHYTQTLISVAAIMNMDYVQNLFDNYNPNKLTEEELEILHKNNTVLRELMTHDYKFYQTGLLNIDLGYERMSEPDEVPNLQISTIKGFWSATLRISLLPAIFNAIQGEYNDFSPYTIVKNNALLTFENMKIAVEDKSDRPKFVFSHFLAPHNPFIFDKDGNVKQQDEMFSVICCPKEKTYLVDGVEKKWHLDQRDYLEQIQYVNKQLLQFIDNIKKHSTRPYIIVIQGDHGPMSLLDWKNPSDEGIRERLSNLNAVYVSDGRDEEFKKNMDHVNIFRNIFNKYFGYELSILQYRGYFSGYKKRGKGKFKDVTDIVTKQK